VIDSLQARRYAVAKTLLGSQERMPTYEYECQQCGQHFERFQRITESPLKKCPQCGGRVKRLLGTGAGIIFKGSGFYQTDYRSESYKQAAKKEASGTEPKAGGSESKGETPKKKQAD